MGACGSAVSYLRQALAATEGLADVDQEVRRPLTELWVIFPRQHLRVREIDVPIAWKELI